MSIKERIEKLEQRVARLEFDALVLHPEIPPRFLGAPGVAATKDNATRKTHPGKGGSR